MVSFDRNVWDFFGFWLGFLLSFDISFFFFFLREDRYRRWGCCFVRGTHSFIDECEIYRNIFLRVSRFRYGSIQSGYFSSFFNQERICID